VRGVTPAKPAPQGSSGTPRDWEYLAALGGLLVGMADESEIVPAALEGVLEFLSCESAELVLHAFAGRPALVGRVGKGSHRATGGHRELIVTVPGR
jgi:hypothetical protein